MLRQILIPWEGLSLHFHEDSFWQLLQYQLRVTALLHAHCIRFVKLPTTYSASSLIVYSVLFELFLPRAVACKQQFQWQIVAER